MPYHTSFSVPYHGCATVDATDMVTIPYPKQTTSCTWPYVVPIGEDPAAHGHWCAFTDLYHTIPYQWLRLALALVCLPLTIPRARQAVPDWILCHTRCGGLFPSHHTRADCSVHVLTHQSVYKCSEIRPFDRCTAANSSLSHMKSHTYIF